MFYSLFFNYRHKNEGVFLGNTDTSILKPCRVRHHIGYNTFCVFIVVFYVFFKIFSELASQAMMQLCQHVRVTYGFFKIAQTERNQ